MVSPPIINTGTFVMVIRLLAVLCANCPSIAVKLLKQSKFNVVSIIFNNLCISCTLVTDLISQACF